MSQRFFELAVAAQRLVRELPPTSRRRGGSLTGRRQVGDAGGPGGRASRSSRFSFRLALAIDLAYVSIGALGGTAVDRLARAAHTPASADAPAVGREGTPAAGSGRTPAGAGSPAGTRILACRESADGGQSLGSVVPPGRVPAVIGK